MDLKLMIFLVFWRFLALVVPPGAYKGPWEPPQCSIRVHFGTIAFSAGPEEAPKISSKTL